MPELITVKPWETNESGTLAVAIPKPIREKLNLPKGGRFSISLDKKGRVILQPVVLHVEPVAKKKLLRT